MTPTRELIPIFPLRRFVVLSFLSVLLYLAGGPMLAAETETIENGLVSAMFEDGALVRLRSTAFGGEIELTGDSAALTVNGEKLAALPAARWWPRSVSRAASRSVTRPAASSFRSVSNSSPTGTSSASRFGSRSRRTARVAWTPVEVFRGGIEDADRPRAQGQQRQRRGVPASGRRRMTPPQFGVFLALQNPFLSGNAKTASGDGLHARPGMAGRLRAI